MEYHSYSVVAIVVISKLGWYIYFVQWDLGRPGLLVLHLLWVFFLDRFTPVFMISHSGIAFLLLRIRNAKFRH